MLLCQLPNGTALYALYLIWPGFLVVFFAEFGLIILVTLCGLYGYQIADQMSIYRISENIVATATIDGVPFILLALLTFCVYNSRYNEVYNKPSSFNSNMDPLPWSGGATSNKDPRSDNLDQIMLATDLLIK